MKKIVLSILIGLILLGLMFGCGKKEKAMPTLTIGHVGHDHQIALGVAALKWEFMKDKYNIYLKPVKEREVYELYDKGKKIALLHIKKVGGASAMPAAMERKELDIGLGGVAAVAFFVDKGSDFKIIAPLHTEGDMLVMNPDFPANNWKEFIAQVRKSKKPIKIGYKGPVAVAKLIFERALKAENIKTTHDESDRTAKILMVNLQGQRNIIPGLVSGAVDGFVMNEPTVSKAVYKGIGKLVSELADLPPEGKWKDHPCCCIAVTKETMENHPKIIVSFLKTILLATKYINENKDEAAEIASKWTKQPLEVEKMSVPAIVYIAEPTQSYIKGMETWGAIMNDIGKFKGQLANKTPEEINEQLLDFSFINKAKAELQKKGYY